MIPVIEKFINGENVSRSGAFSSGAKLTYRISVPRRLGTTAPILRIHSDGEADVDLLSHFVNTDYVNDIYELELDTSELIDGDEGLLYYTFVFPYGSGAYFTDTCNNVDISLSDTDNRRFLLLIYKESKTVPKWLHRGVMYHIFVDRFCKGNGETRYRDDSVINEDWEHGVPQYGVTAGAYVENNMFFGGNLWGVAEKLDYLAELGVTVIYLSPIFEAKSNHKYDTGDYMKIDSGFGGDEAFLNLVKKAKKLKMHIVLDGVFNHTGDDSRYFDRYGRYGEGAFLNEGSPYRDWYKWKKYPDEYESWWGIPIMPRLNHANDDCRHFFTGKDGVIEKYLKLGASGWRIDVADELDDSFLDELGERVKTVTDGKGAVIGEVWENAADKIAYGKRRRYLRGGQLDSVMNYPLRNGIISFVKFGDAETLYNTLTELYGSYPRKVCDSLMNIIGTHDTERILTVLGGEEDKGYKNADLSLMRMSESERKRAKTLLKMASVLQFTVYGIPSLYYGDEAGVEGYHDPFCRLPFPWGREDVELIGHYKKLGALRRDHKAFDGGEFNIICHGNDFIAYERRKGNDRVAIAANRGERAVTLHLEGKWSDALTGREYGEIIEVLPDEALVLCAVMQEQKEM